MPTNLYSPRPPLLASLGSPMPPTEVLYRGALAVLRSDPILQGIDLPVASGFGTGLHVRGEDGDPEHDLFAHPGPEDVPCVRMTFSIQSTWEDEQSHRFRFLLPMDLYSPGTSKIDALRLLDAVQRAFYPQDDDRRRDVEAIIIGKSSADDPSPPGAYLIRGTWISASEPRPIGQTSAYALRVQAVLALITVHPTP